MMKSPLTYLPVLFTACIPLTAMAQDTSRTGGKDPASAANPANKNVKITAEGIMVEYTMNVDGKERQFKSLGADLTFRGGLVAEAYALGMVTFEPFTVGRQRIESDKGSAHYFREINRTTETSVASDLLAHPEDGIKINLDFGDVPEVGKSFGPLTGSVWVMVGGSEHSLDVSDIDKLETGPLNDPILTKAGMRATFHRDIKNGKAIVGIEILDAKDGAIFEIKFIGAKGKIISGDQMGHVLPGNVRHSIIVHPSDLTGANVAIRFRDGGKKVAMPFHVPEVRIAQ